MFGALMLVTARGRRRRESASTCFGGPLIRAVAVLMLAGSSSAAGVAPAIAATSASATSALGASAIATPGPPAPYALPARPGAPTLAMGAPTYPKIIVSPTPVSRPLPHSFVGMALEYSTVPLWAGPNNQPVNPVLVHLVQALNPSGDPIIRIGGESTDRSWWPVPDLTRPPGVTYALTPAWGVAAHRLVTTLDGQMMLGLNLEADDPQLDQVEADEMVRWIGLKRIMALTIGNEPPLYTHVPWYKLLSDGLRAPWYYRAGAAVFARPPDWSPEEFLDEYSSIQSLLPPIPIAGPETSDIPWMTPYYERYATPGSPVDIFTSHAYALNSCIPTPTSPAYPTVPHMLSYAASHDLTNRVVPFIREAHNAGALYRIDELGSITCNGRKGVSNSFSSALWMLDSLFSLENAGVDGVNLHSFPHSSNGLFDFTRTGRRWTGTVHPMYYGALMFARADPPGAELMATARTNVPSVRTWATRSVNGTLRVVVINDSLRSRAHATIHLPAPYDADPALLQRLSAPSAFSTAHVSLGGRSFGPDTPTGGLPAPLPFAVRPVLGALHVQLKPSSAVLLTIRASTAGGPTSPTMPAPV